MNSLAAQQSRNVMNKLKLITLLLFLSAMAVAQDRALLKEFENFNWQTFNPKSASPAMKAKVNEYMELLTQINLDSLNRTKGSPTEIKSLIINGNKIKTIVYNYGSITRPNVGANVYDLVWNRLGYGYEFAPLVTAEVREDTNVIRIVDDGLWLSSQGDYSAAGLKWGWLPTPGYAQTGQSDVAAWSHRNDNVAQGDLTRKPHSWPESWYNAALGRYVWPAYLGNDATSPDEEVYFVMDDYTNAEFPYYPFPSDSTKRGLGLEMECRFFQFNNPLAEDIIFLVYRVTNKSPRTLDKVWFGMYGDPHVGGSLDYLDDYFGFYGPKDSSISQRARNIVYAWDEDGVGAGGLQTGYFGFKFLESPTNSTDLIDNDDDGIIDESPFNDAGVFIDGTSRPLTFGIADTAKYRRLYGSPKPRWSGDENGDWSLERDDVGIDGLPGTADFGEGNGRPDVGRDANNNITAEPNFGIRDVNESDQIGLTSFWAATFDATNYPRNDALYFERLSKDTIGIDPSLNPGDNVFLYGSGPFPLAPQGTQRFSIALLMGESLADLLLNSETAQRVLEANYRFAQPPPKPRLAAIPGDKRVTLFWDDAAETAVDPLTNTRDFEGYKIYRSEDYTFSDVFTITDANGSAFLGRPMEQKGIPAQLDIKDNGWQGLHPVEYLGRGVKYQLGSNTGLVHEYVDSSVTNGKKYFYAVASYDHGLDTLGVQLPPSESQIAILKDPVTQILSYDVNTAGVTPGPLSSGSVAAGVDNGFARRARGISTGDIRVKVLDNLSVPENVQYNIDFDSAGTSLAYSIKPLLLYSERFTSRDTIYVSLSRRNLVADSIVVLSATGAVIAPTAYRVDALAGRVRGSTPGALPAGQEFEIRYRYYAVFQSKLVKNEDANPTFDGLRVYAKQEILGLDSVRSNWVVKNNTNLVPKIQIPQTIVFPPGTPFTAVPLDFEIRWNSTDTTANGKWRFPGDTLLNNLGRKVVLCPFRIVNVTDTLRFRALVANASSDSMWRPGREIAIITPQSPNRSYMAINFAPPTSGSTILPAEGNVYAAKTTKPFAKGDQYTFTTKAVKYDPANRDSILNRIYVVPNPYVAYSLTEAPGTTSTRRGENDLQFRNLPAKCTIRIYTIVGELVTTIQKDDNTSFARWNILSSEGQRLAYGIYLYHVDAPGLGEKIGRLALIK